MSGVVKGLRMRTPLRRNPLGGLQLGLQDAAQQLAGLGLRQLGAEHDRVGRLGRTQPLPYPLLDLPGVPLPDDHGDQALATNGSISVFAPSQSWAYRA
jgi:hypothetical protein